MATHSRILAPGIALVTAMLLLVACGTPGDPQLGDGPGDVGSDGSGLLWSTLATSDRVLDVTWSPDDRHVLATFPDNAFALFDRDDLELVAENGDVNFPNRSAWDPDGNRLIGAAVGVRLYAMPDLAYVSTLLSGVASDAVSWSPGETTVAIAVRAIGGGSGGSDVVLLQPGSGDDWPTLATIETATGIEWLEWDASGEAFVATGRGRRDDAGLPTYQGFVHNVTTGTRRFDIADARHARWSPDGAYLAVVAEDELRLLDARSGDVVETAPRPGATVLAWSGDGTGLFVGGLDGRVERRSTASLATREVLATLPSGVTALEPAHDGGELAIGTSIDGLVLLEPASGSRRGTAPYGSRVQATRFDPVGRRIATTALVDPRVRVWDATSGALLHEIPAPDEDTGTLDLAWSPDGTRLALAGATRMSEAPSLRIFDTTTWQLVHEISNPTDGIYDGFYALAWLDDHTIAGYIPGFPSIYRVFDLDGGTYETLEPTPRSHTVPTVLATSADRSVLVMSTLDGFATYDVASGETREFTSDQAYINVIAVDADGRRAITTFRSFDLAPVTVWDLASGEALLELAGLDEHLHWLHAMGFSPDGDHIWVAGQRTADTLSKLFVYDIATGELVADAITTDVHSADLASDGSTFALGSWEGELEVYDLSATMDGWLAAPAVP